jgi:hypothetical protein
MAHGAILDACAGPKQPGVCWVIVRGVERPLHFEWVRKIGDQCAQAGVAFAFLGWGAWSCHAATHAIHVDGRIIERPQHPDDPNDPIGREDGWTSVGRAGGDNDRYIDGVIYDQHPRDLADE